jgi:hypothetical protein
MNTIIAISHDPVLEAMFTLNQCGERIASLLSQELTIAVRAVAPINGTFWADARVGTQGASLLAKLAAHIELLAAHYPSAMNEVLRGAGHSLEPQPDGSVVYNPQEGGA